MNSYHGIYLISKSYIMSKNVAKGNFIKLYYELLRENKINSQAAFARMLDVSPQSLTPILEKTNKRSVSMK